MITTTLGQLVAAQDAFVRLMAMKLPVKAAYHLKKLAAIVRPEVQHFQDVRVELVKELGRPRQPDGDVWDVLPDHVQTFQTRVIDLGSAEVTLPWGPFDLAWLGDQSISAADLDALGPLVQWAEDDVKK